MARKPQTITVDETMEVKETKEFKKVTSDEIKIGEEVVISDSLNQQLQKIKETPKASDGEVSIVEPVREVKNVKMVKIKLAKAHRCNVGGEWYVFKPNTQYNVPEQVKKILMRREGLLLPL